MCVVKNSKVLSVADKESTQDWRKCVLTLKASKQT